MAVTYVMGVGVAVAFVGVFVTNGVIMIVTGVWLGRFVGATIRGLAWAVWVAMAAISIPLVVWVAPGTGNSSVV